MLTIVFALLLCIQAPISQGESESVAIEQVTITTATPVTEIVPPIIESTPVPDVSTAPDASATPQTTTTPAAESLPPIIASTPVPDVSSAPNASATAQTTTTPAAESLPPIIASTPVPDASTAPDASATPQTTTTPAIEDIAPTCDIPDCPHMFQNENGITIALCLLGEWMIAQEQAAPGPFVETSLGFAPDLQTTLTNESLSGGDIQLSDFTAVVLDGTSQITTAAWSINNITDTRETGDGWNLSLTLTQFKEWSGSGYVSSGDTLDPSSVRVNALPEVNEVDETSSSAAQITVVGSATALDTGTPVKLLTCGDGEGMGGFSVSGMTIALSVPANVYAHTYKTDAIIALNTGP